MTSNFSNVIKNVTSSWWTVGCLATTGFVTYLSKNVINRRDSAINELFHSKISDSCDYKAKENANDTQVAWTQAFLLVGAGMQFSTAIALTVYRLFCRTQKKALQNPALQAPLSTELSSADTAPSKACIGPPPGFFVEPVADLVKDRQMMYAARLTGHRNLHEKERAVALFQEMKSQGVPYNEYHYSIMIDLYANSGDLEGALGYLQQMCSAGIEPTFVTYGSLLKCACMLNNASMVERLVIRMQHQGVQLSQINCFQLCDWYASEGQMDKAQSYYMQHPRELAKKQFGKNSFIDLHGMTAGSAYFACLPFFTLLKRGETLCLITGKGNHSKHGGGFFKLRDTLMALIKKHQPQLKVKVSYYDESQLAVTI